ncbi:MAG: YbhB/YbcL family Raf kinase inhibitor-like protein, partial [Xanthobacteraceae bacterium]
MGNVKVTIAGLLAAGAVLIAVPATAATLKVHVDSFKNGDAVPNKYAFCAPAAAGHTTGGQNINPSISWSKGPKGTKSYAIILYDTDSPAEHREMMNKEGVTMTSDIKRHDFFHWVLVDIPANVTAIK